MHGIRKLAKFCLYIHSFDIYIHFELLIIDPVDAFVTAPGTHQRPQSATQPVCDKQEAFSAVWWHGLKLRWAGWGSVRSIYLSSYLCMLVCMSSLSILMMKRSPVKHYITSHLPTFGELNPTIGLGGHASLRPQLFVLGGDPGLV